MTVINAFADKVECPRKACIWHDEPESKGNCHASACPFDQSTRDRWFDQQIKEQGAMNGSEIDPDLGSDPW